MKKVYELDKKDIAEVLAKHFGCNIPDVYVRAKSVGYGPGEHIEYTVAATVSVSVNQTSEALTGEKGSDSL